jgi:hypothetical protein
MDGSLRYGGACTRRRASTLCVHSAISVHGIQIVHLYIVWRTFLSVPQIFYFSEFCGCLPTAIGVATHLNYYDHHGSHNVIVLENLLEILRKSQRWP